MEVEGNDSVRMKCIESASNKSYQVTGPVGAYEYALTLVQSFAVHADQDDFAAIEAALFAEILDTEPEFGTDYWEAVQSTYQKIQKNYRNQSVELRARSRPPSTVSAIFP